MLGFFRRYLGTWPVRILFVILVLAFGLWGVADVVRNLGSEGAVAVVDGTRIEAPDVQQAYRTQMQQVQRMLGAAEPTPDIRREVAERAVGQLVAQAALAGEVKRLDLAVPDDALRQAVYDIPAFKGPSGTFDKRTFDAVMANNGLTEGRFLDLLRGETAARQFLDAAKVGIAAPDEMVRPLFAFQMEKRVIDVAELNFKDAPPAPAADAAALQRWYDNHPDLYSTAEYRRIKAVILSPEALARGIEVSDEELRAAYDQRKDSFGKAETRSAEVIQTDDPAKAQALASLWRSGADWARMQEEAQADGGTSLTLDDTTRDQVPSAELAEAIFATPEGQLAEPVQSPLGWYVVKVTKLVPGGGKSFEEARDELRKTVAQEKAADLVYDRAAKVEDALASGSALDDMPGDLGLVGVTGTLDAKGNTPEGEPVPMPGSAEFRAAVVAAAFQARQGEPAHLAEGPDHAYFAVSVEEVIAPKVRPFEQVADKVRADAEHDALRRMLEQRAAGLTDPARKFADAAAAEGVQVTRGEPIGRDTNTASMPQQLVGLIFNLKVGQSTMFETANGFVAASVVDIRPGDPEADAATFGRAREALTGSLQSDVENMFATALRDRAKPRINAKLLDQIAQP